MLDIVLDIIQTFDYECLMLIADHWRGGLSDTVWTVISMLGNGGALWIVTAVVLLFFRKTRRAGAAMLVALLIGLLVGNVLIKEWVMRPRPFVTHADLTALLDPGISGLSPRRIRCPALRQRTALWFFHRKSSILAYLAASLIAFSRLYASVHYPTDILAGVLLGICAGWLPVG